MVGKLNRRRFLAGSSAAILATQGASAFAQAPAPLDNAALVPVDRPGAIAPTKLQQRADNAFLTRMRAAQLERANGVVQHPTNGDEALYPEKVGAFTKTLPHNQLGEVNLDAYGAFINAIESGAKADFEAIPQGGPVRLTNPQAAYAFDLSAPDPYQLPLDPAPSLASPQAAAEMVEVYWHALLRDVGFDAYQSHPAVESALADLSRLVDFRAPKVNGRVTAKTLFRANTPGDLAGPYLSQFLCRPVPLGAHAMEQRYQTTASGVNHMTAYDAWLAVQNGNAPETQAFDAPPPLPAKRPRPGGVRPSGFSGPGVLARRPDLDGAGCAACATVLKAFFDEEYVLPDPVAASSDGLSLVPYRGENLMVGGELNKLASNISLGRDFAGVHYRSDGIKGMELGEAVAMGFLAELRLTYHEPFEGFTFKTFDGTAVAV